jgi:hypothetical protein
MSFKRDRKKTMPFFLKLTLGRAFELLQSFSAIVSRTFNSMQASQGGKADASVCNRVSFWVVIGSLALGWRACLASMFNETCCPVNSTSRQRIRLARRRGILGSLQQEPVRRLALRVGGALASIRKHRGP